MFKSLIIQKLESNFGPRNYKQDWLLQAREKLSWVRDWVWPNLTVNHQVISGITETRANLLTRRKFRGSSAKFNNGKDRPGITANLESVCCQTTGKQHQFVRTWNLKNDWIIFREKSIKCSDAEVCEYDFEKESSSTYHKEKLCARLNCELCGIKFR